MCVGSQTYGKGGFGSRSTLLMVRMKSSLLAQKLSGFLPGTLRSSSRTCWSAKKEKEVDVAREERKSGKRVVLSFIVVVERKTVRVW